MAPVDGGTAAGCGRLFALLCRTGRPIPVNDLWLAATALQHGLTLVTLDRHFEAIDGLATASEPADLLP